jgi:hypothetical protein
VVWEDLQEIGWIDFGWVTETIAVPFVTGQTQLGMQEPGGAAVVDLMHLNAAEIDLPTAATQGRLQPGLIAAPRMPFRLQVSREAAHVAIEITDSGPFVGHDPRATRRFWDVTVFSSDASKLAWLCGSDSLEELRARFIPTVRQLGDLYRRLEPFRQSGSPAEGFAEAFLATHLQTFPVRATLWRAKLGVILEEENPVDGLREVFYSLTG